MASCEMLGSSCHQAATSANHHDHHATSGHHDHHATSGHHDHHPNNGHHHDQVYASGGHHHDQSGFSNGHSHHHDPTNSTLLDRSCSSLPSNSGDSSNLSAGDSSNLSAGESSNLSAGESSNISNQSSAGNDSGFISHNSTDQGRSYKFWNDYFFLSTYTLRNTCYSIWEIKNCSSEEHCIRLQSIILKEIYNLKCYYCKTFK